MTNPTSRPDPARDTLGGPDLGAGEDELGGPDLDDDTDELGGPDLDEDADELGGPDPLEDEDELGGADAARWEDELGLDCPVLAPRDSERIRCHRTSRPADQRVHVERRKITAEFHRQS